MFYQGFYLDDDDPETSMYFNNGQTQSNMFQRDAVGVSCFHLNYTILSSLLIVRTYYTAILSSTLFIRVTASDCF